MTGSRRGAPIALFGLINRLQNAPLYPTFLSIAFVIEVWRHTSLDAELLVRPIAVVVPAAAILTALTAAVARNSHRGGVAAGILTLGILGGDDPRVTALTVVALLSLWVLVRRDANFRQSFGWPRLTRVLNLVAVVMLLIIGLDAFVASPLGRPQIANTWSSPDAEGRVVDGAPDILVILLDGHGRQDLLAEFYGEDASPFIESLVARGFDVSPRSRSNYMSTQLTLASMFNFAHLSDLDLPAMAGPAYGQTLRALLDHNRAFDVLRVVGYHIETVSAGYDGLTFRSSDVVRDGGQINELEGTLIANVALKPALNLVAPEAMHNQIRERVIWNLSPSNWLHDLRDGPGSDPPVFLFVHVPSPHPPYLFARDGAATKGADLSFANDIPSTERTAGQVSALARAYSDQLAFIDMQAIRAIDEVLLSAASDTVVIVMSDHGPGIHLDFEHLTTADPRERFGTLFAARTPGTRNLFGEAPTPVNLFPTLLNHYVGLELPFASDASFVGVPPRQELIEIGNPDG